MQCFVPLSFLARLPNPVRQAHRREQDPTNQQPDCKSIQETCDENHVPAQEIGERRVVERQKVERCDQEADGAVGDDFLGRVEPHHLSVSRRRISEWWELEKPNENNATEVARADLEGQEVVRRINVPKFLLAKETSDAPQDTVFLRVIRVIF